MNDNLSQHYPNAGREVLKAFLFGPFLGLSLLIGAFTVTSVFLLLATTLLGRFHQTFTVLNPQFTTPFEVLMIVFSVVLQVILVRVLLPRSRVYAWSQIIPSVLSEWVFWELVFVYNVKLLPMWQ